MRRTAVINLVGLTESLLNRGMPQLQRFRAAGTLRRLVPAFPAVTCTAQANYLTGQPPRTHGIVGNGWYHRELAEVHFWKQSNHLVAAPKLWDLLRAASAAAGTSFTCAQLFWWFNMYSAADYSITPRPLYPADGRKIFDIHTWPYSIRFEIQHDLGPFPFPCFWGPAAGRPSPAGPPDAASRWIAASARWIEERYSPTLSLIYLPHLDYNLQRYGPPAEDGGRGTGDGRLPARDPGSGPDAVAPDLAAIDSIAGDLIAFFRARGVQVVILSEYGLVRVNRPIHLNRAFRERGWLTVKDELGLEVLDPGASRVFAVADHQVAHVYVQDPALEHQAREVIESLPGVGAVLGREGKHAAGLDHPRAGDLVAVAREDAWFTYYYWLDEAAAPDFARCVDIHRKPGYDPVELFTQPAWGSWALRAKLGWRLLQKRLGLRMLMDVIPLAADPVRGSHGCRPADPGDWPVLLTEETGLVPPGAMDSLEVCGALRRLIAEDGARRGAGQR